MAASMRWDRDGSGQQSTEGRANLTRVEPRRPARGSMAHPLRLLGGRLMPLVAMIALNRLCNNTAISGRLLGIRPYGVSPPCRHWVDESAKVVKYKKTNG